MSGIPAHGITYEDWLKWEKTATRNRTDPPIGATTVARRVADAYRSRLVETQRRHTGEDTDGPLCAPQSDQTTQCATRTTPKQENAI